MSKIWAKSRKKGGGTPISLAKHTNDVLEVFKKLEVHVKVPYLKELIRLAIVCHDWGKVLPAFQIQTLGNTSYEPKHPYTNIPHSLFSIFWIDAEKLRKERQEYLGGSLSGVKDEDMEDYVRLVLSSVAYHHWRQVFIELLGAHNSELVALCEELQGKSYIKELQQNLYEEIKDLNGNWQDIINGNWQDIICFNKEMVEGLKRGVPFSEYAPPPYQLYWLPKRVEMEDRKLRDWILLAGFLMRADHFASFCEEEDKECAPEIQNIPPNIIEEKIEKKIREKISEKRVWQLEEIKSPEGENVVDSNVILIAPTGYGKTEFAFLWSNGGKFFYTLPLQAAVNQIFERAQSVFGEGKVGLLHSDADVYLLGDGGEAQASLSAYDLARQLAFPALIATGDQFFPYALRPPGYEKIYATFSYSRLVIDEVQAYDPRAAAIIVKFLEDVIRMGGKFLLMTATLPKFVQKEVEQSIGQGQYKLLNLYEEEEDRFQKIQKNRIRIYLIENNSPNSKPDFLVPDNRLEEILSVASEGKRVMVIANTVKQAQDIFINLQKMIENKNEYKKLNGKLWLLHSRFTQHDRKEKERDIQRDFSNPKPSNEQEGKILVATQVVEASLDMDADVLFTEIAPLDALVQRMGRVLRRYGPSATPEEIPNPEKNPNVYIWVFREGLHSGRHHVYDSELVLLTLKLLKDIANNHEENYKEWLKKKHTDYPKAEDRIKAVVEELFGATESLPKKERGRKRNTSSSATQNPTPKGHPWEVILSEYDKFALVEKLYDLPEDHSYMSRFLKTRSLLDAGYMSERLEEARKLFRDIHTISVVPEGRKGDFLRDAEKTKEKSYTEFKKEVLAKYVVAIPYGTNRLSKLQPIQQEVEDARLHRWCRGIYVGAYEYDEKLGIREQEEDAGGAAAFYW